MTTHQYNGNKFTFVTNNVPRKLFSGYELSEKIRAEHFDYLSAEEFSETSERFFQYRGYWYDTHEFQCVIPRDIPSANPFNSPLPKDHPIIVEGFTHHQTDSYFSGVCFRYAGDESRSECVVVGLMLC